MWMGIAVAITCNGPGAPAIPLRWHLLINLQASWKKIDIIFQNMPEVVEHLNAQYIEGMRIEL